MSQSSFKSKSHVCLTEAKPGDKPSSLKTKKPLSINDIRHFKSSQQQRTLQMLTCYDYQGAQMLAQTDVDMLLVGDSLGNVVLGHPTTIPVKLEHMLLFGEAVKRGAPHKFIVVDMPFGTYASHESGMKNAIELYQKSQCNALKIEGASPAALQLIRSLKDIGLPVMGHIGLKPQSIGVDGPPHMHGKAENEKKRLLKEASDLRDAGVFSIVLECVVPKLANLITQELDIPTIGIGSGPQTDGQVLVINDLFHLGQEKPPRFVDPLINLFQLKRDLIQEYLKSE